jgi:BlaI family penicillinase repressor
MEADSVGNNLFQLGQLQLAILKVLWANPPLAVTDLHRLLPGGKDLAPTTIATMLRKMEERKLVSHQTEGRKFLYAAAVSEGEISHTLADHLLTRVFEGSLAGMVSHLLNRHQVSSDDLEKISRLIAEHKAKERSSRK